MDKKNSIPRLNQCFLCKKWDLEEKLSFIEIPDQGASYVKKMACQKCLKEIIRGGGDEEKNRDQGIH